MKLQILKYLSSLMLVGLLTTACSQDAEVSETGDEPSAASLTMTFAVSGAEANSRGLEDLDGSRMFSLAVFVVDENNEIKGRKSSQTTGEVTFSSDHTQATVTFDNLNYGETYQLLAIANFGGDAYYKLADDVEAPALLGGTVSTSSTGNLCAKETPYPLTLKKEIVLQPGSNTITGELVRTFARIRITVRNQSSTNDLQVKSLSFPEKFTYQTANLFGTGGNTLAQPNVSHAGAVNAFTASADNPLVIAKNAGTVQESTIFDTYLLESSGGTYSYTLSVSYGESDEVLSAGDPIRNISNLNSAYSADADALFLIQVYNGGYLYADGTSIKVSSSASMGEALQNEAYWWTLEKLPNSNGAYYVKSVNTGYINSNTSSVSLVDLVDKETNDYFTFSNNSNSGMYMKMFYTSWSIFGQISYYLLENGDNITSGANYNRSTFIFHPITSSSEAMEHTEEIPISVIDTETGIASPITSINRNDLINILVNVSYSEELGEFIFEVTDWNTGGGDVSFE